MPLKLKLVRFKNSAIFHNGHLQVKKQTAKLILTNSENKDKSQFKDMFRFGGTKLNVNL